jgi:hypothetical protein
VEKDHEQKTKRTRLKNREEEEEEERASRTSKRNLSVQEARAWK